MSTIRVLTFYDFAFRAHHRLAGKSEAAAQDHWHSYSVRFCFEGAPDQDGLSEKIEGHYRELHGSDLTDEIASGSSDENLAKEFLQTWMTAGCVRVIVTNDGRRGAEAFL